MVLKWEKWLKAANLPPFVIISFITSSKISCRSFTTLSCWFSFPSTLNNIIEKLMRLKNLLRNNKIQWTFEIQLCISTITRSSTNSIHLACRATSSVILNSSRRLDLAILPSISFTMLLITLKSKAGTTTVSTTVLYAGNKEKVELQF